MENTPGLPPRAEPCTGGGGVAAHALLERCCSSGMPTEDLASVAVARYFASALCRGDKFVKK